MKIGIATWGIGARIVMLAACVATGSLRAQEADETPPPAPPPAKAPSPDLVRQQKMANDASERIGRGKAGEAIDIDLDPLIAEFAGIDDGSKSVYSPRWLVETIYYMAASATGTLPSINNRAIAVDAVWGRAFYLKGFALMELHRTADARAPLERAVALAPQNSQFLSELGYWHAMVKDWPKSLAVFRQAAGAAEEFSPPNAKNKELARAWRGIAYVDVELGELDEAAAYYERCLALDANDARARRELGYVRGLQQKAAPEALNTAKP